jgi:hypothetical protein
VHFTEKGPYDQAPKEIRLDDGVFGISCLLHVYLLAEYVEINSNADEHGNRIYSVPDGRGTEALKIRLNDQATFYVGNRNRKAAPLREFNYYGMRFNPSAAARAIHIKELSMSLQFGGKIQSAIALWTSVDQRRKYIWCIGALQNG